MNVGELIEELQKLPPDATLVVGTDPGIDYSSPGSSILQKLIPMVSESPWDEERYGVPQGKTYYFLEGEE